VSEHNGRAVIVGRSALTGWRRDVGRVVARPIARRTRWSEAQVEAVIGFLLLAYTLYRIGRPLLDAARKR
jgi:hypothetical protein